MCTNVVLAVLITLFSVIAAVYVMILSGHMGLLQKAGEAT